MIDDVFLLFRPTFLSARNRWRRGLDLRAQAGRDTFLMVFSLMVMIAVYVFTGWALREAGKNPTLAVLPPHMLLGFTFAMVLLMLGISSVLSALGTFFLSDDLEIILPSPTPWWRIFSGKYLYVFLMASWMPFLFTTPMLLAFGVYDQASWEFYVLAPILMIPYFMIPAGLGVAVATLLVIAIPVYRARETFLVIIIALLVVAYIVLDTLAIEWNSLRSAQELLRVMALITAPSSSWLPSYWLGNALGELLRPAEQPLLWYGVALASAALGAVMVGFLSIRLMHRVAYSNIRNKRRGAVYGSRRGQERMQYFAGFLDPAFRGLIGKEVRVLARDISQVVQLFMLIGLALVYLYHMRLFSAVESFPEAIRPWWKNFLFIGNITMGAFVVTAMCTRFVVPSVSLEGRSFWILQTCPITISQLVKMKFRLWLLPTALVSVVFYTAGAMAIGADFGIVLLCGLASVIVSYGVVGLAIGFGTYFAHFEWEHASQLAGSVGSLLFMLAATFLIFLNMIPAWILLAYGPYAILSADGLALFSGMIALVCLVLGINVQAGRIAMREGIESLEKRLR